MNQQRTDTSEINVRQERSRIAWFAALAIAGLSVLIVVGGTLPDLFQGQRPDYGFFLHITSFVYTAFGVLIIYHQPRNTVGWLILFVGFLAALSVLPVDPVSVLNGIESGMVMAFVAFFGELLWILPAFIPVTLILQLFPDGRLLSPRWRVLTVMTILAFVAMGLLMAASTLTALALGTLDPGTPPPIEGNLRSLELLTNILLPASILGSVAALIVRFRRSNGAERAQLKWLVYMVAIAVLAMMLSVLLLGEDSWLTSFVFAYFPTWLAIAMGIAILRYRLFDIDIIIRRSLQYGLLTAVLIAIYFGVVLLAQSAFVALTGEESPLAIVVSTLVIAALFNPLRKRLQAFIDRRFYRHSYDAAQTLQAFAQMAREEVDLEQLTAVLLQSVNETMQPEWTSLWLRPNEEA